jgi:hypothetical protein
VKVLALPLEAAQQREAQLLSSVLDPIHSLFERAPPGFGTAVDGRLLFPNHRDDLPPPATRGELLLLALHVGCTQGLERLEGRGVKDEEMLAAIGLMTKDEVDWLQALWTAASPLWVFASEVEEELTGVVPDFEARAVTTRFGLLAGGFWPAAYCRRRPTQDADWVEPTNRAAFLDPLFVRAGTSHKRVLLDDSHYKGAVSLSAIFVQLHLAQVIHDLAFRPAILSIAGLILDPQIDAVLRSALGVAEAERSLRLLQFLGKMPL